MISEVVTCFIIDGMVQSGGSILLFLVDTENNGAFYNQSYRSVNEMCE